MSTPFTKASDLAVYITQRLALITTANGYHTNIGQSVFRGKRAKVEEQIPCAVIIEGEDHPGDSGRDSQMIEQDYVVGGYVECDPDNPNDAAHLVIKDLKKVLFGDHGGTGRPIGGAHTFGGRVKSVEYKGRDIGPRPDGVAIVFAVVHFTVKFSEILADA